MPVHGRCPRLLEAVQAVPAVEKALGVGSDGVGRGEGADEGALVELGHGTVERVDPANLGADEIDEGGDRLGHEIETLASVSPR